MYKALENQVTWTADKTSRCRKSQMCWNCCNIEIDVIILESEGIKIICEIISNGNYNNSSNKGQRVLDNLPSGNSPQFIHRYEDQSDIKEYNPNRKF